MVDVKISALSAIASVAGEDLVAIIDDPSGTPVSRKATIDQIKTYIGAITADSTTTFTNKTFDADGTGNSITNIENADIKTAAGIAYSKLDLSGSVTNDDLAGSIALSKLATDPLARANHTGTQTASTISDFASVVGSSTATLTNKTFDANGTGNSITNIENADISASAAIAYSKLNLSNSIVTGDIVNGTIALGDLSNDAKTQAIVISASDETTALEAGTAKATFRMPFAFTLTAVRASLTTAGTGANLVTVDINEAGTTILSTKITIDATEKTSTTAATAPVISDSALADDAEITIDIDQIDSGAVSAGLKVYLIGYKT